MKEADTRLKRITWLMGIIFLSLFIAVVILVSILFK
jgi:preprotein translocase subunit SecG